jgi:hypothetical protein
VRTVFEPVAQATTSSRTWCERCSSDADRYLAREDALHSLTRAFAPAIFGIAGRIETGLTYLVATSTHRCIGGVIWWVTIPRRRGTDRRSSRRGNILPVERQLLA